MTPTSTNLPRTLAQLMRAAFVDLHDYALAPEAENALASLREIADQLDALPEAWADDTALLDWVDTVPVQWYPMDEDAAAGSLLLGFRGERGAVHEPTFRAALRAARDAATQDNTGD